MKQLVLGAVLALSAGVASAQNLDGNSLLEVCSGAARGDVGFCWGYVAGVMETRIFNAIETTPTDGGDWAATLENIKNLMGYCAPANVHLPQQVDVFKSYLENNPAQRHLPGNILFTEAMKEAFLCE